MRYQTRARELGERDEDVPRETYWEKVKRETHCSSYFTDWTEIDVISGRNVDLLFPIMFVIKKRNCIKIALSFK